MERALDLNALQLALGVHESLPSPAELQSLMAETEIGLFIQRPAVPAELLRAGWYLHGVASSDRAQDLYSIERQRRAFQVSAHVFELALSDGGRSDAERLRLAFGAQVGYRQGELEPNAMAVYARFASDITSDRPLSDHLNTVALEAGVAFLGFEIRRLFPLLRALSVQFGALRQQLGVDSLDATLFAAPSGIVEGAIAFLNFLARGHRDQLAQARLLLAQAAREESEVSDLDARWVAAHLARLADDAEATAVWTVLPPDIPSAAKQAFTLTSPPVLSLWKPQVELLTSTSGPNALHADARRVLLSLPTSAGKTLVAQMLMVSHLASQPGSVCYVAPTRSLGREVRRTMAARLAVLRRELGRDLPDYADFDVLDEGADRGSVDVMTPERLMHLVHRDSEAVLARYAVFIFDEAHMLAERGRGLQLETLLAFLHWRTRDTHHRLILLSAAFGNRGQLMAWLDPAGAGLGFASDWRGPRRLHAVFTTDIPSWDPSRVETVRSADRPLRQFHDLTGVIRLRPAEGARIAQLQLVEPVGEIAFRARPDGTRIGGREAGHSTPGYKTAARVAAAVGHGGPVLIIMSSRVMARQMARAVAELVETTPEGRALAEAVRLRLGPGHPLVEVLPHGVAYHHGGLPVDVLEMIEDGIRDNGIQYLAATSTLTEGVNLPVRTVVVAETRYEDQPIDVQLRGARLINAMGRAGRATKESEGWIVLCRQAQPSPGDFGLFVPDTEELEVRSRLVSDQALDALAAFEDAVRATGDAIFTSARDEVQDFISFVWFVLAAEEELGRVGASADLPGALEATLAFSQLDEQTRRRWAAVSETTLGAYEAANPQRRRRWPRAGTSIGTARSLDELSASLATRAEEIARTEDIAQPSLALTVLDEAGIVRSLLALPEAQREWGFRPRQNARPSIDVDATELLRAWLEGTEVTDLADAFLPTVNAADFRIEQMVDAITEHFEHFLAWTIGVVIDLANERLGAVTEIEAQLCPNLPLYVRYGVDSPQGVSLALGGVRSRRLNHAVAQQAQAESIEADGLDGWLASMSIADWRERFHAARAELLDLIEYTRTRRAGALADLLERGQVTLVVDREAGAGEVEGVVLVGSVVGEPLPCRLGAYDEAGTLVAVVPSPSHADVQAVLDTGLALRAELVGRELTLALVD